jgi:hypothetical protein
MVAKAANTIQYEIREGGEDQEFSLGSGWICFPILPKTNTNPAKNLKRRRYGTSKAY